MGIVLLTTTLLMLFVFFKKPSDVIVKPLNECRVDSGDDDIATEIARIHTRLDKIEQSLKENASGLMY